MLPEDELNQTDPHLLARLMKLGDDAEQAPHWEAGDLGPIMAHQLRASLEVDLSSMALEKQQRIREVLLRDGANLLTFNDLLHHPKPPVELLRQAKDYARSRYEDPQRILPAKVATMLYYACIAAARVRHNERITDLDDAEFAAGLRWATSQDWIERSLRELLAECLGKLDHPGPQS